MNSEQIPIDREANLGDYLARWLPEKNKVFASVSPELSRQIVDEFSKSPRASRIDLEGGLHRHCGYEMGGIQSVFIGFAENWLRDNKPDHPSLEYLDGLMSKMRDDLSQGPG